MKPNSFPRTMPLATKSLVMVALTGGIREAAVNQTVTMGRFATAKAALGLLSSQEVQREHIVVVV